MYKNTTDIIECYQFSFCKNYEGVCKDINIYCNGCDFLEANSEFRKIVGANEMKFVCDLYDSVIQYANKMYDIKYIKILESGKLLIIKSSHKTQSKIFKCYSKIADLPETDYLIHAFEHNNDFVHGVDTSNDPDSIIIEIKDK